MTSILIVDDHKVVREGIKQFLASTPDLAIAGEASSVREAIDLVRSRDWDLVLLDLSLPDGTGLEALKLMKRERPLMPVLIFSNFSEQEYALAIVKAGASGYLCKDSSPAEVRQAIRTAAAGNKYVGPGLAEQLLGEVVPGPGALPHQTLTPREREVMLRIARGQALTQIGRELHRSVKTISTYRSRILTKLQVDTNADLTRYVMEHRLDG